MCSVNLEVQLVNPSTQVALFSLCIDECSKPTSITWNIYQGSLDVSTNIVKWSPFNRPNFNYDHLVFGKFNSYKHNQLNI